MLLPTGFSIGSIKINGKTFLKLLQLYLLWRFVFKAFQDPEEQRQLVAEHPEKSI